jgi:hypothetical protein
VVEVVGQRQDDLVVLCREGGDRETERLVAARGDDDVLRADLAGVVGAQLGGEHLA